jgi:hypothetical protein
VIDVGWVQPTVIEYSMMLGGNLPARNATLLVFAVTASPSSSKAAFLMGTPDWH